MASSTSSDVATGNAQSVHSDACRASRLAHACIQVLTIYVQDICFFVCLQVDVFVATCRKFQCVEI